MYKKKNLEIKAIILTQATGKDWSGPKGSAAETGLRPQLSVILLLVVHDWDT